MEGIDKKTIGELLIIIGGFILAETIIRTFLDLASETIEPWVLPLFSIAIIINGVELKNGVAQNFGSWISWIFLAISIILIVLEKSGLIGVVTFAWVILILSVLSLICWFIWLISSKKKDKKSGKN
ncbi:Uncharacterised protein [uncultured archaeon]|nr:Uncharacterised protein [uncultured archaeon]